MGFLRLFFSFGVLAVHAYPIFGYSFINSSIAVNCFFIISGFYMALIIKEKYIGRNNSYKKYITNRLLRIFPLYYLVLFLILIFALVKMLILKDEQNAITHLLLNTPSSLPFENVIFLFTFLIRNLTLIITPDYIQPANAYPGYLLLQQSWSLQVELIFYLIAPFLLSLNTRLLTFIVSIFCLFIYKIFLPFNLLDDNSLGYIILTHFIFFFMGIYSYYLLVRLRKLKLNQNILLTGSLIFIICLVLGDFMLKEFFSQNIIAYEWGTYIIILFFIPILFITTSRSTADKYLGELAYPVFISHFFIIKLLNPVLPTISKDYFTLVALISTVIFSVILIYFVERPINIYRQKSLSQKNNLKKMN